MRRNESPAVASAPVETREGTATPTPTEPRAATQPPKAAAEAPAPPSVADAATDAGTQELRPSHPLTPRHARIYRENNLMGAMEGAMDVRDGRGLRHLLQQYQSEFPDDPNQLQQGYGIIANCLEHPGPDATAAGQQYYDRERGSTLRRFVARYCMGEP